MSHETLQLQLELGETLGEGTSGVVAPLLASLDSGRYVVKRLKASGPESEASLAHEIRLHRLCSASCASIVRYAFACQSRDETIVIMEACDSILWDALTGSAPWKTSLAERHAWTLQLCSAVMHCHSLRVLHRDINPWNILLSAGTGADGSAASVRLGDFGLAAQLSEDMTDLTGIEAGGGAVALDESALTSLYSAPELGQRYGFPADVFSLGMTVLALWASADCSCNESSVIETVEAAKQASELPKLNEATDNQRRLIFSMVAKDPSTRPDAAACYKGVSGQTSVRSGQKSMLKAKQILEQHGKASQGRLQKGDLIKLLQELGHGDNAQETAFALDAAFSSLSSEDGSIRVDHFLEWIFQV